MNWLVPGVLVMIAGCGPSSVATIEITGAESFAGTASGKGWLPSTDAVEPGACYFSLQSDKERMPRIELLAWLSRGSAPTYPSGMAQVGDGTSAPFSAALLLTNDSSSARCLVPFYSATTGTIRIDRFDDERMTGAVRLDAVCPCYDNAFQSPCMASNTSVQVTADLDVANLGCTPPR